VTSNAPLLRFSRKNRMRTRQGDEQDLETEVTCDRALVVVVALVVLSPLVSWKALPASLFAAVLGRFARRL